MNQKRKRKIFNISHRKNPSRKKISILNMYMPNTRAPSYVKETLLRLTLHFKPYTLIVGDHNTPLSPLDRSDRQKLIREIRDLTDVTTQMDLTNIHRILYPNI